MKTSGVSNARNLGIANANGKYIAFIDSDDYVDNKYLEKLYMATNNEEIDYVRCLRIDKKQSKIQEHIYNKDKGEFKELYNILLNTYELSAVSCGLIKTEIIKNNGIKFDENYSYAEDYGFNIELFKYIRNFNYINYKGYYYCYNSQSLTRKIKSESIINNIEATIKIYTKLYEIFTKEPNKVNNRIEREINHILDSLFYANTKIKIKDRIQIYNKVNIMITKKQDISNTLNMKLLSNRLYIIYDFKNYLFKKIPRKIKRLLMKGNMK